MGLTGAFKDGQFDNILPSEPLRVSKIKHRAIVEVTKDGTVAATASAIEVPELITVDKPFLFYIRDKTFKTILYAGKISNPNV